MLRETKGTSSIQMAIAPVSEIVTISFMEIPSAAILNKIQI
jgi:hypothetical protein